MERSILSQIKLLATILFDVAVAVNAISGECTLFDIYQDISAQSMVKKLKAS